MSLISLAKYNIQSSGIIQSEPAVEAKGVDASDSASATPKAVGEKRKEYIAKIILHVPFEAIIFYVFASWLFRNSPWTYRLSEFDNRTVSFFLTLVLAPVFVWYLTSKKLADEGIVRPFKPRKEHLWKMAATLLTFTVWSSLMSYSIFMRFRWYDRSLAWLFLILVVLVLPKISDWVLWHRFGFNRNRI